MRILNGGKEEADILSPLVEDGDWRIRKAMSVAAGHHIGRAEGADIDGLKWDISINMKRLCYFTFFILIFCCYSSDCYSADKEELPPTKNCNQLLRSSSSKILKNGDDINKNADVTDVTDVIRWNLKKGADFVIQKKGSSTLEQVKFEGVKSESEEETILLFNKGNEIVEIRANDIYSVVAWKVREKFAKNATLLALLPSFVSNIVQLTVRVFISKQLRTLAEAENIKIIGNLIISKELGQTLLENMIHFDKAMTSVGFIKPELIRVVVKHNLILPNLESLSHFYPAFNIPLNRWKKELKIIIVMYPLFWDTNFVENHSALYHERMRTFLYQTYKTDAFINENQPFLEAFSDFLVANFLDSPQIGYDNASGIPIKDISKRTITYKIVAYKEEQTVNLITKVSDEDYRANSLLISNLLWRIRRELGQDKILELMKPLIDDLNLFRKSFLDMKMNVIGEIKEPKQRFVNNLEYFFAVLKKIAQARPALEKIESVVNDYVTELNLDSKRVDNIAFQLLEGGDEKSERSVKKIKIMAGILLLYATYKILRYAYLFIYF